MAAQQQCSWCAAEIGAEDGYWLQSRSGSEAAVFCRLEHIVPWVIKDARWDEPAVTDAAGWEPAGTGGTGGEANRCSYCKLELANGGHELVRRRETHRVVDVFCDTDHLKAWAQAGGRWQQ